MDEKRLLAEKQRIVAALNRNSIEALVNDLAGANIELADLKANSANCGAAVAKGGGEPPPADKSP